MNEPEHPCVGQPAKTGHCQSQYPGTSCHSNQVPANPLSPAPHFERALPLWTSGTAPNSPRTQISVQVLKQFVYRVIHRSQPILHRESHARPEPIFGLEEQEM